MPDTFHYPNIVLEITEGMRHVLQASDWKENALKAGESVPYDERRIAELGNLEVAISRVKNAYNALVKRYNDIESEVRLQEQEQLTPEKQQERETYMVRNPLPPRGE